MNLQGCKALVTGAEGFIGSHLVEQLAARGVHVRAHVLYNSFNSWGWLEELSPEVMADVEVFMGDVTNPYRTGEAVEGMDAVFHLAALIGIPYSYHAPEAYVATNVQGTLNILQACRQNATKKIVHTSTSEVYGSAMYVPIDEKHPLRAQSPYSASKIGADMLAQSYELSFGLPVAICRPFNTYGPRQSSRAVIPTIITQLIDGAESLQLGSLTTTRDFNYVKDTAAGFIAIAESDKTVGEVVNLATGKHMSIGELAEKIMKVVGRKVPIESKEERKRPDNSEVLRLCGDAAKARELLGWRPTYTIEDGLRETVAWLKENHGHFKSNDYVV